MWTVDNVITQLKKVQEEHNIKGSVDAGKFCRELGLDNNGLVYLFSCLLLCVAQQYYLLLQLLKKEFLTIKKVLPSKKFHTLQEVKEK